MVKRRADGLTQKQFDLIDFCFEFISEQGYSPTLTNIAEATGYNPGNIGTSLSMLGSRVKIIHSGAGMAVIGVNHPTKGQVEIEETFYDPEFGASYFAKEYFELPDRITRRCLECKTEYETRSKYIRLCNGCRAVVTALNGEPDPVPGGYISNAFAVSTDRGMGRFRRGTK